VLYNRLVPSGKGAGYFFSSFTNVTTNPIKLTISEPKVKAIIKASNTDMASPPCCYNKDAHPNEKNPYTFTHLRLRFRACSIIAKMFDAKYYNKNTTLKTLHNSHK